MGSLECLLCKSQMAAHFDEVFITHLKVQHGTFSNHKLIFNLSRLDQNCLEGIIDFANYKMESEDFTAVEATLREFKTELSSKLKTTLKDPLEYEKTPPSHFEAEEDPLKELLNENLSNIVGKLSNEEKTMPIKLLPRPEVAASVPPPLRSEFVKLSPRPVLVSDSITAAASPPTKLVKPLPCQTEKATPTPSPLLTMSAELPEIQISPQQKEGGGTDKKLFQSVKFLSDRLSERENNCMCSICGRGFLSNEKLKRHAIVHDDSQNLLMNRPFIIKKEEPCIKDEPEEKKIDFDIGGVYSSIDSCAEEIKDSEKNEDDYDRNNDLGIIQEDDKVHKWTFSSEERKWCIDMFERWKDQPGWYDAVAAEFLKKFPYRAKAPRRAGIYSMVKRMEMYNTCLDRKRSGRPIVNRSNICDVCGFVAEEKGRSRSQLRDVLRKHKENHHSEEKECPDCGKLLKGRNYFVHRLSHLPESERKFKCSFCGKGCITKSKLKEHEYIHTDERPFSCKFQCGYSCKNSANIIKHEKCCVKK